MKFGFFYLAVTAAAVPLTSFHQPLYFFTFGDSYTETSFNVLGKQPTASNPMGNPALGTGTTGGGINWVGRLATTFNESLVLSYNLAVGGATIDNNIVGSVYEDMSSEVATFQLVYRNKTGIAPWDSSNAVFGIWIGINDVGNGYQSYNASETVPRLMARYKSLIQSIYADGGRNFLLINVPPTSRSPFILDQGLDVSRKHAAWLADYNEALKLLVLGLIDFNWDMHIVWYDSFKFMNRILDNPHEYGFKNSTCINDDGIECVWWNNYHPGQKYHLLQAKDMRPYFARFQSW